MLLRKKSEGESAALLPSLTSERGSQNKHYTTVCVRKPDVRFSAFSKCLRLVKRPVFRRYLKSGLKRPVFGSSGPFTLQRPDFECPVPNRPNRPN